MRTLTVSHLRYIFSAKNAPDIDLTRFDGSEYYHSKEKKMTATKMLHIRVDDDLGEDAAAIYRSLGLSMSEAVRLFLHRSVASQGLPLELKVPNETTRAALLEARQMRRARKARFATPDELFADLNNEKSPD